LTRKLRRVLIVLVLVVFLFLSYRSGTYTNTLRWEKWWVVVQKDYYSGQLTRHDMSVVEACAQDLDITPDRVILTLLYKPNTPNPSHWETCEEPERFKRIDYIQKTFIVHRAVAYHLTHRGRSNFWQYLVGQAENSDDANIAAFERLPLPTETLAQSQK